MSKHRCHWQNPRFAYESQAEIQGNDADDDRCRQAFPDKFVPRWPALHESCKCGSTRRISLMHEIADARITYPSPRECRNSAIYTGREGKATPAQIASVVAAEIANRAAFERLLNDVAA